MSTEAGPAAGVPLARKVAFLSRPAAYPGAATAVEAIETHMAWVFLTRSRAYKLKKPVRYAFLDFSTLEARRRDCEEEVRLNRALAPDVYLGTVPLTAGDGGLAVGGGGSVVDWLVVMRRLERARMLDRGLAEGAWTSPQIDAVVAWLVRFYAQARRVSISPAKYRARLAREIEEDRAELVALRRLGAAETRASAVAAELQAFIHRCAALLDARVDARRIVEGHGDLRPEHVYLGPPPAVIDCIEFNASFRELDVVDDLAFLALECERLGAAEVGRLVLDAYARQSKDRPTPALVAFYMGRRALLRAKIALWHLRDHEVRREHEWVARALRYVELAEAHAAHAGG